MTAYETSSAQGRGDVDQNTPAQAPELGVVAIGRNEGERLEKCIRSAIDRGTIITYVDSGSTDGSPSLARKLGADVVSLDMRIPFTAARARNVGYARLRELAPQLAYVQFVDGDCELAPDWIDLARKYLDQNKDVAVVCGRRREKYPMRSIYNQLCDLEWNTPIGETKACGGDALIRAAALEQVGRYRDDLIAGEEPELCFRLREAGWKIRRLDADMTSHDAAMVSFSQWWRRHRRSGYAFAQGAYLHGRSKERYWVWETVRALVWGIAIPISILVAVVFFGVWGLLPLLLYLLQFVRRIPKQYGNLPFRIQLAAFEMLTRFPESLGVFRFVRDWLVGRPGRLIEYK
jgi:GT2 family glycosyltransferase